MISFYLYEFNNFYIQIFENGFMYNHLTNKEIKPQKDGTVEFRDLEGNRIRHKLNHLIGFYFKAPWRQGRCYRCASFINCRNYFVTADGEIFSLYKWNYMKGKTNHDGYREVTMINDFNKQIKISVHRLVAQAFIPNPDNKPEVNHKDGNKLNNNMFNLEWVWTIENIRHAQTLQLRKRVLSDDLIHQICKLLEQGYSEIEISRMLNIGKHLISYLKAGGYFDITKNYNIPRIKHFLSKPSYTFSKKHSYSYNTGTYSGNIV